MMRYRRLTVTQMSRHIKVSKANLYHFTAQMVRDGILSEPETSVKGNYVEKYYRLEWKSLASVDLVDQRRRVRELPPKDQKEILESFLASASVVTRLLAEEVGRADEPMLERIHNSFKSGLVNMSYLVLPDDIYEDMIRKLNDLVEGKHKGGGKNSTFKGNRVIILGIPQLYDDSVSD